MYYEEYRISRSMRFPAAKMGKELVGYRIIWHYYASNSSRYNNSAFVITSLTAGRWRAQSKTYNSQTKKKREIELLCAAFFCAIHTNEKLLSISLPHVWTLHGCMSTKSAQKLWQAVFVARFLIKCWLRGFSCSFCSCYTFDIVGG